MTPETRRLLDYVRDYIAANGIAPSYSEMQAALDGRARGCVFRMISGLVEGGFLVRRRWKSRGLALPDVPSLLGIPDSFLEAELRRRQLERANG